MTTHPKREYTPEEIEKIAFRLDRYGDEKEIASAVTALRSLASQLAAQKRDGELRDVAESLCRKYIANRHAIGLHDHVCCITPYGRCSDSEVGRLWLRMLELSAPSPDQDREVSP